MESETDQIVPAGYVATLFDLTGRHAVVVGGASGLGAAIALGFAQAGARLSVVATPCAPYGKTSAELSSP